MDSRQIVAIVEARRFTKNLRLVRNGRAMRDHQQASIRTIHKSSALNRALMVRCNITTFRSATGAWNLD